MDDLAVGLPAWGLFAVVLVRVVLDFYERAMSRTQQKGADAEKALTLEAFRSAEEQREIVRTLQAHTVLLNQMGGVVERLVGLEEKNTEILQELTGEVKDLRTLPCRQPEPRRAVSGNTK